LQVMRKLVRPAIQVSVADFFFAQDDSRGVR
jgi:hypothetical protein